MISDITSITKIPAISGRRISVPVTTAKPAMAPPRAKDPVSPMYSSPGKALYQRKPIVPPISAAASVAMSSNVSLRAPGSPERSQAIPAIARKVRRMITKTPAARPSIPSVRFAPLTVPAMTRKSRT
jgi:hypothetical protein